MTVPVPAVPPRNGQAAPLIELRHVRKVFGGGSMFSRREVAALKDFSLSIGAERPSVFSGCSPTARSACSIMRRASSREPASLNLRSGVSRTWSTL